MYSGNIVKYKKGQSKEDEKNTIYHELLHVLSYHHEPEYNKFRLKGLYEEGAKYWSNNNDFYEENIMLEEIMNEFYTTKMMETEGLYKTNEYELNKSDGVFGKSSETVKYHGNGYIDAVQLAELYDKLFGNELLKAKLYNKERFAEKFNETYKDLNINLKEDNEMPLFDKIGNQIAADIYGAYGTAIDIWKINKKDQLKNEEFDLYAYLKDTKELIEYLPKREDSGVYRTDKSDKGVPSRVYSKIAQMDSEFICEYINPDIMRIEDENIKERELNTILSVINILREDIQDLSEQDIENISYGKIKEYTHDGKDCLVINTKSKDYMTFVNNSTEQNYQFSAYSKFKKIPEFQDLGYTKENEDILRKRLTEKDYDIQDLTYATVYDSGEYGLWSLAKSNNKYYKTSGEISEVKISDLKTIGRLTNKLKNSRLDSEINDIISETTSSDFNEMSQTIKKLEKINEQTHTIDDERI